MKDSECPGSVTLGQAHYPGSHQLWELWKNRVLTFLQTTSSGRNWTMQINTNITMAHSTDRNSLKNKELVLKSESEKDRGDVAGLGNDFWNLLSNDLDKDTLFSSSVLTLSIHLNFRLTSSSQNSNSHKCDFLPCLRGEEFVHLCRQWPNLNYSCLLYILAEL